jgi:inorganic pyrophosphatase
VLIVVSYQFRPESSELKGVTLPGNTILGLWRIRAYLWNTASALSGYVSMWVASQSNIRVASAARRTYGEALIICFRGGAFSAVLNLTLCITGVTMLYVILHAVFVTGGQLEATDIPMLCVGFGFGSSFVALFMQLGGGIYTKAADVVPIWWERLNKYPRR